MTLIKNIIESHYKPLILNEKQSDLKYLFFIDCFDVIDLIKGVKRYSEGGEKRNAINDIRSLGYGLILDGWVENINLLPPHQTEFINLLKLNFGIRNPHINDFDIVDLINEYDKEQYLAPDDDYLKYIERTVDMSLDRFNIYSQCRENNWANRLKLLTQSNILKLVNYDLNNLVPLVERRIFKQLKRAFDTIRSDPKKQRSNFNDALSLTYFQTLKTTDTVPILIDSLGTFQKAIREAKLEKEFTYKITNKSTNKTSTENMVRRSAYLVLKSIFDPPESKMTFVEKKFPEYFKILKNTESNGIISIDTLLEQYDMDNLFVEDDEFREVYEKNAIEFKDYVENEFFSKIWLSSYENNTFQTFIKKHYEYQSIEILNRNNTISAYKASFDKTYESIKKESHIFSTLTYIYKDVSQSNYDEYLKEHYQNAFQALMLYGSFRFSFPYKMDIEKVEQRLREMLFEDGLKGEKENREYAQFEIIKLLFNGLNNYNLSELSIAVSILWTLEKYNSINKIFSESYQDREYSHYSFGIMHAASLLKEANSTYNKRKAKSIVECIENKINIINYKYLIGKSFVYYLIWNSENRNNFTSSFCLPTRTDDNFYISRDSISKAFEYLREAQYHQYEWKTMLYMYALNLKIYIITEGGIDSDFQNISLDFNDFRNCESSHQGFWQGRYDDTIARYYFRLAIIDYNKNNIDGFKKNLEFAQIRIRKAISNSFQDLQIKENFEQSLYQIEDRFNNRDLDNFLQQCIDRNTP
jgi:hypothetical protein